MAPEIVLLFKAKHDRDKDQQDLVAALPLMNDRQKSWLLDALSTAHPDHRWRTLIH